MCAYRHRSQAGDHQIPSEVLQDVQQADLIKYGLIPEFVGRFPVLCALQVCTRPKSYTPALVSAPTHSMFLGVCLRAYELSLLHLSLFHSICSSQVCLYVCAHLLAAASSSSLLESFPPPACAQPAR